MVIYTIFSCGDLVRVDMLVLSTDFHGQSRNSEVIRNTLKRIADAGFSHVHWCHEFHSSYVYSVYEMLQIKKWCDEFGLLVMGVHASAGESKSDLKSYISFNEYNRLAGVDLIQNRIETARILETDMIVLHLEFPWELSANKKEFDSRMAPIYKSLDALEPYCKTRRIKICIENGDGSPEQCLPVYDALFNRYDENFLGLCFDTGHANIYCKKNSLEYAERYNNRLFLIHGDDNHGETDEHAIPYEGTFNWAGFAPVLARSPYKFPLLLELACRQDGDDAGWLKTAFETGNRFSAMAESYRG